MRAGAKAVRVLPYTHAYMWQVVAGGVPNASAPVHNPVYARAQAYNTPYARKQAVQFPQPVA